MRGLRLRWRSLLLVPLVARAGFSPAIAEVPSQVGVISVFEQLDLFGNWSPECRSPASRRNPRVTFLEADGRVVHEVSFGGAHLAVVDEVRAAERIGESGAVIQIARGGTLDATVTIQVVDGRLTLLRSVRADGRVVVDDGVELATHTRVPADEKCAAAVS